MNPEFFRRCSTCKSPIHYDAKYYKCSVSTCNRRPTALYFCSVPCWDAHVPDARHRDAWAEEERAPTEQAVRALETEGERSLRRVVSARAPQEIPTKPEDEPSDLPRDVLVVMSKVKSYIKARSGLRTSDGVSDPLSDHVRQLCTSAIRSAAANDRTTVLARDIEAALRGENAPE